VRQAAALAVAPLLAKEPGLDRRLLKWLGLEPCSADPGTAFARKFAGGPWATDTGSTCAPASSMRT
jgi:hypothetical protein